jgi:hypothetical protein
MYSAPIALCLSLPAVAWDVAASAGVAAADLKLLYLAVTSAAYASAFDVHCRAQIDGRCAYHADPHTASLSASSSLAAALPLAVTYSERTRTRWAISRLEGPIVTCDRLACKPTSHTDW